MVADGPVTPTRLEITDEELRRIYALVSEPYLPGGGAMNEDVLIQLAHLHVTKMRGSDPDLSVVLAAADAMREVLDLRHRVLVLHKQCERLAMDIGIASAARPDSDPDDEETYCTCVWSHPVDGSIDPDWPAETHPDCPVHADAVPTYRDTAPAPTEGEK